MRIRKSIVCSCLVVAALSTSILAAQSAQPRRKPDVPYVPTTDLAVAAMLKLADVKKSDVVYDLGCGDGRIVIAAAKQLGARGVGIDIDSELVKQSTASAMSSPSTARASVTYDGVTRNGYAPLARSRASASMFGPSAASTRDSAGIPAASNASR